MRALGDVLRRAGYSAAGFRKVFGARYARREASDREVHARRLATGRRLDTLFKLFFLRLPESAEHAAAAFAPLELDRLEAMNVLRVVDGRVESPIEIGTLDTLLVASDPMDAVAGRSDHASGLSISTLALAAATPRRKIERALDVGTGTGAQALAMAHHATEVVATDVNRRALTFAAFNALLNRVENLILREGSLFEPVAGETFDLVASNPPYVIGPEADFMFRDSGLRGDAFVEKLVRELPAYLNEAGFGAVLLNWIVRPREKWAAALRRWVRGSGCDAIFAGKSTWNALDYAAASNFPLRGDPRAFGEALDRWVEHIRSLDVREIAGGLLVLRRRRRGRNWIKAFDAPTAGFDAASADQVLRLFDAQDYVRMLDDATLLETRFAAAPDLLVELKLAQRRARLGLDRGLGLKADVDPETVNLLVRLDGTAPLKKVIGKGDEERATALTAVRRMLEHGFVSPSPAR